MTAEEIVVAARVFATHTCWDAPDWDGTMEAEGVCAGCDEAAEHPCAFCGYGHIFTTHNPEPHWEGNDPILAAIGDEGIWWARYGVVPYVEGA